MGTEYNFIFLDIQMPIMDGFQTVAEIRKYVFLFGFI